VNILPQITQITQRNAAKLHYHAEKDRVVVSGVIIVLGFVCVNQRDLREIYWGFVVCRLIESSCVLFSRRLRRLRRGMQQAALSRRERQIGQMYQLLLFWVSSA
jgi:hypothetical protein